MIQRSPKKILVTGGSGLLGAHLLYALCGVREEQDEGFEILATRRSSTSLRGTREVFNYGGDGDRRFACIRWIETELDDYHSLREALEGVDQVYHCAAQVSFRPRDARNMIAANREITACVVRASIDAGVKRFLHVSSSSAIGNALDGEAATEDKIWVRSKNSSAYSESKFASEMEVWRGFEEGLEGVIVNPVIILGPGFWSQGSSSMMDRVAKGMKYATPGVTGYVGVEDVVRAMLALMDSEIRDERFILSEGDYSYMDMFSKMARALGQERKFRSPGKQSLLLLSRLDALREFFTGRRMLSPEQARSAFRQSRFSTEKVRKSLDFSFTPIDDVLAVMARCYKK